MFVVRDIDSIEITFVMRILQRGWPDFVAREIAIGAAVGGVALSWAEVKQR